jgi:hypothetical protein
VKVAPGMEFSAKVRRDCARINRNLGPEEIFQQKKVFEERLVFQNI